jgi:hypothetical protein
MAESLTDPIEPLPGQLEFPQFEEPMPETRSRWNRRAWELGKAAAKAGKSLLDCPDPEPRGYGESVSAKKAHRHYVLVFRRWWRDGFLSVTVFPLKRRVP